MKRTLLTLYAAVCVVCATAQTLDECRRLARDNYPEIKQYDLISLAEQYNLSNATRTWIPQITLSGQATYQSATPTYSEAFSSLMQANGMKMTGIRKDQYKVVLDVSQHIWDGGQSKANRAIAEAEAKEQRLRIDVSLYNLQAKVDDLYFGILLLDARVAQSETFIRMLASNMKRMQAYYKSGVARQADVDAIEAELLTARQTLRQIEASRASYRSMLELFIGQPLSADTLERPAMRAPLSHTPARPELALFNAQEYKLFAQRKLINSALMPRFSAFAQGYYGYPGFDIFKSMTTADWTINAIVGVRMSWNIGAFYTKRNNIEKLNIARKQIAVQRDVFLFNTRMLTTQESGEIKRLQRALEEDNRIVELRHRVRIAAESQLENGVIDATDLLQKISEETTAVLSRNTHEIELLQAVYKLKTTLNQ